MPKVSDAHLEARRRQIVDAAVACFARQGFHRTSMQDIYAESGLSAGAVYRYFAGKDEIIATIAHEVQRLAGTVAAAGDDAAPGEAPLTDLLEYMIGGFERLELAGVDQRLRLAVQLWAEALRDPKLLELERDVVTLVLSGFAARVRHGQDRGELDPDLDPESVGRAMLALLQGLILQRTWSDDVDLDGYWAAVRALLGGLSRATPL